MIYICIPAYNEERTVGVLLWKIRQVMASFPRDYQILAADDGSTDGTAEVLSPYQRVLPLTVVRLEQRSGYASALELLLREAVRRAEYPKRDVIITLQADFTDDPDELLGLLKQIEAGADIVAGNAALPVLSPRALRWPRRVGNFLLKRRGLPEGVVDPLCGLRAYRVIVIKRALEARGPARLLTWDGWAANAELLQLTQPHSRRTEGIDCIFRGDRQQRPSRNTLWPLLVSLVRYARGGAGPLVDAPLPTPVAVDLRDERRAGRRPPGTKEPEARRGEPAVRERPRNGKPNGRGQDAAQGTGRSRSADGARPKSEGRSRGSNTTRPEAEGRRRTPEKRPRSTKPERPQPETGNGTAPPMIADAAEPTPPVTETERKSKRRRRKRRGKSARPAGEAGSLQATGAVAEPVAGDELAAGPEDGPGTPSEPVATGEASAGAPRKRRSRRGGRGRRGRGRAPRPIDGSTQDSGNDSPAIGQSEPAAEVPSPRPVDSETS